MAKVTESKSQTLRVQAYDGLVEMILSGEFAPGQPIDERTLTERFGVSRTPIREAIGILAKEGLVEVQPYKGFSVRQFTTKEVHDIYELRRTLECFAIRLAVDNIANTHIAQLEVLLNAGIEALEGGDLMAYGAHDRGFHELIAELSGNDALVDALAKLSRQIQIGRMIANQSQDFAVRAAEERDQILDALRTRNADEAARLMDAHIRDVQQAVMRQLAENPAVVAEPDRRRSPATSARAPRG